MTGQWAVASSSAIILLVDCKNSRSKSRPSVSAVINTKCPVTILNSIALFEKRTYIFLSLSILVSPTRNIAEMYAKRQAEKIPIEIQNIFSHGDMKKS